MTPYRAPHSHEEDTPTSTPNATREALGHLRSSHGSAPLGRTLLPAILAVAVILVVGITLAPRMGPVVFAVIAPFALLAFALLGWSPLRARGVRVDLHEGGVVVDRRGAIDVMTFDAADEVWMVLDPARTPVGGVTWIRALRVVDHDRSIHAIPTNLPDGAAIAQWVLRHTSNALRPDATRALHDGERLTFGDVRIDREGLDGGSWSTAWSELSLVRFIPGEICLFHGAQHVVPWKRIRLDRIPHPMLFAELVTSCAKQVEVDDPLKVLR